MAKKTQLQGFGNLDPDMINALIDNPYECPIVIDDKGLIRFMSRFSKSRIDIDPKTVIGKHISEILPETRLHEVLEEGTARIGDTLYLAGRQQVISRIPLRNAKDKIIGAVGKGMFSETTNVQELHCRIEQYDRLYEQVMQEKSYAETVIQCISDGVVTTDRNRVILSWNNGAERTTGFGSQEVLGKTCSEILAHQDESGRLFCETDHCPVLRAADPTCPEQIENVFIRIKSGKLIPVSMSSSAIVDGSGRNIGAVDVFRDISKEVELNRNVQLVSQAKSNFLASMSHELRTPLNAILGFSEVLLEECYGPINDKQREYVSDVILSGKLLLSLINDILDLSKIEAGEMELDLGQFYIVEILESSLLLVRTNAVRNGIHLNLEIPKDMETFQIEADKGKLIHVLYNLLSNAVKFTPTGGSIVLKVEFPDPSSKILQVIVEDTGIGINPDLTGRIFDNFYQIQNGVVNKTPGTGMGLSISRQIIRLHGGDIRAESEGLGYGSRFVVEIPSLQHAL